MASGTGRGPLSHLVLDEIALEGLEGITLPSLWVYLGAALELPLPLPEELQQQVWSFIQRNDHQLYFYELPSERETIKLFNRFDNVDEDFGVPVASSECPVQRYKYVPIQDGEIKGSCEYYKERKPITASDLQELQISDVLERWGAKFIIVASQDLRYSALTPVNVPIPREMTSVQYCVWEAVGRGRYNGETTAGNWSLQHFCKDPTMLFYIKNKLRRYGLVTQQSFSEKRNDRITTSHLLCLPRFYSVHHSMLDTVIEKLFHMIKATPQQFIPMTTVRQTFDRKSWFNRIMVTHLFRRVFETKSIPYSKVHGTERPKCLQGTKEKVCLCISLRNPNIDIKELFADEVEDEHEDNCANFHSERHSFVDMPLKDEFYRAVARHGARGLSQTEICHYLSVHYLCVRLLIKKMVADGMVKVYCVDEGRQRLSMYVAVEHAADIDKKSRNSNIVLENLQCAAEPVYKFKHFHNPHLLLSWANFLDPNRNLQKIDADIRLADIPQIAARVQPYEYVVKNPLREAHTERYLARKTIVIDTVDEQCVVQAINLRNAIIRAEREQSYKDEMCLKSMGRLLSNLAKSGIVRIYEIRLQCEETIRSYRYVTHPKIVVDHDALQREVLKLKNLLFLQMEERRLRNETHARDQERRALKAAKQTEKAAVRKTKQLLHMHTHKPPKFLISRYMHEFLFYIVVELNEYQQSYEIDEQVLLNWQQSEPALQPAECMEQLAALQSRPVAYASTISWRTFIPPLPKYADKPAGWVYFVDAMDRMPLSLFNKIFRLEYRSDNMLAQFLAHPVLQHLLMRQLPPELQCQISRIHLQRVYGVVLRLLNHMGLVQVTDRLTGRDPLIMWLYFNRRTKILDTTSSEASYSNINPDRKYDELQFEFASFDDVHQYWTQLHRICVYTKLGFRHNLPERGDRLKQLQFVRFVDFDEAPLHDVGQVPGDHLGAAGLSTRLFAHTFRNWSWVLHTNSKPKATRTGRLPQLSALRSKQLRLHGIRKTRTHLPPVKRLQHGSGAAAKRASSKKKSMPRDAIDRDALKNMRTLRVTWHHDEDNVLKMARAVYQYMAAPVLLLGLVTVGRACRDIIRHHLGIFNKTTQACVRRIHFIVKTQRHVPEVPTWVHLLHTNEQLQRRYGDNYLQKLKQLYPNRNEYSDALVIHFVCLLLFLYKQVCELEGNASGSGSGGTSGSGAQYRFTIPNTLSEFRNSFQERQHVPDEQAVEYQNPSSEFELQVQQAINVLHSSMCCERDKTLYTSQAFEIYKSYSEEVLHAAFTKARKDALVVALKRKQLQLIPTQLAGPAYLLSSRYRSRLTLLRISYVVFETFFQCWQRMLSTLFGPSTSEASGQVLELKSPQQGQLFMLAEGLACDYWECSIKLPINILTVDAEQRQTLSAMDRMDRILDHYQSIFDNAPQTEYTKNLESETNEKQVRVKFHPANLSYKIHYSPYDFISKLPARYLHFFCALDHLHQLQPVDINFSRLHHKDDEHDTVTIECPFNCILKNANYINAIERIVQEKRAELDELSEMPPQKLLNMAMSGCSVTVQPSNLLTLVRMLESFWREKEATNDRKDLGKLSGNVKVDKSVDWHQLCREILEFDANDEENDKIDEYEPTLNKEERIARAQDVFVVNLPTLQLGASAKLRAERETVLHSGIAVPKCMVEAELQRETILQKILHEARWKYTDNSFATLKPHLKTLNLNDQEVEHLEEVHNFIEAHKLGVAEAELLREFPYTKFLARALKILGDHYLIKRVGVATVMYAHKSHMRPWMVHTFHIKRLERESLGGATVGLKRKRESTETLDEDELEADEVAASSNKKVKLAEGGTVLTKKPHKRVSKPVKRFDDERDEARKATNEPSRDIIVMKPHPWLRLNGSINRRVLDRWLGSILTECIARTGSIVQDICTRFVHMVPVDVMFLLEILCDLRCIHLVQIEPAQYNLFSEYENIKETPVIELYDPKQTYVHAHADAVTRLAVFIGHKKYNTEFI